MAAQFRAEDRDGVFFADTGPISLKKISFKCNPE